MADLERQLRELSSNQFESFVHQYLTAVFPGAGIKRVDGSGGDSGVDSFSGFLRSQPTIWQCKHFPDRIRKKQKEQVLNSIQRAFHEFRPSSWVLCVPINLRTPEHKWFQEEVVDRYGGPETIKLLQASDFVNEILHNRSLRDAFFPESAISDIYDLRKAMVASDERSPSDVEGLLLELAQQYLESKMDLEPRLCATVEIGGSPEQRSPANKRDLVLSITDSQRTLNLFARDPASYNLDPIQFTTSVASDYGAALNEAMDTGRSFKINPGGIRGLTSSSPLLNALLAGTDVSKVSMELRPYLPTAISSRIFPLRFVAGSGNSAKELFYVPFRTVQVGRKEATLSSNSLLPITITVVLRTPQDAGAKVNFRPVLVGADVQQLGIVLEFLDELERSGTLEVFSLDTNERVLGQDLGGFESGLDIPRWVRTLVADSALVSRHLKIPLTFPAAVTPDDAAEIQRLVQIVTGCELHDIKVNGTFTFSEERRQFVLTCLDNPGFPIRVDIARGSRSFEIFGNSIDPGPTSFFGERCNFLETQAVRDFCATANDGDTLPICIQCEGPCHWERSQEHWKPDDAFKSAKE